MQLMEESATRTVRPDDERNWPAEAREAMSALDDSFPPLVECRQMRRRRYRASGTVRIQRDAQDFDLQTIYTRDINPWHIGVICNHPLPVGQTADLETRWPDGRISRLSCQIRRCHEFTPGWFEANLHFAEDDPGFTFAW